MSCNDAYNELCYYTLSHGEKKFIHQHVVDAVGAQEALPEDKPIRLVFALIGLYLNVERGFTGREVQLAHMKLGRIKQVWPIIEIPTNRGSMNAAMVLAAPISDRDSMIHEWCRSVWLAFDQHRETIERILEFHGITDPQSVKHVRNAMREGIAIE